MIFCKICNKEFSLMNILSAHIRIHHNITTEEYYVKYMNPNVDSKCPLCDNKKHFKDFSVGYSLFCKKCRYGITLEKCIIRHGKDKGTEVWDNYRKKQAKTNTFEYKQKKFNMSKEDFDIYNKSRAITLDNCQLKHGDDIGKKVYDDYIDKQRYTNSIEYFKEVYGELGKKKWLEYNKSKAHTLESYVKKYGKKIGTYKYKEYCDNNRTSNCSKISQKLFDSIYTKLKYTNKDKIYYFNLNKEFGKLDTVNKTYYFYDFVNVDLKKVIEFNGNNFHVKPNLNEVDKNNWKQLYSNKNAYEVIAYDETKLNLIKGLGFEVLEVWEDDFKLSPDDVIENCVSFLKGNNIDNRN